ncbi:hypothetical protein MXB_256 [Myxobolus squamalis]|nr:hypothetical protein MXB_256 [Myxobolus squamalis]
MIRESLFYEADIDLEKFIEHHIKLDHLDQIRNELEIYYINVKNTAVEFIGCSIDRFFTLNYNDFSETFNSIIAEFTQIKSRIDELIIVIDTKIIQLSSFLQRFQHCLHEKRNSIMTLNIINYNHFLDFYIDNYETKNTNFETVDQMILSNDKIINLIEVMIEMKQFPTFAKIPSILKNIINFSDDKNHYKIENRFNEVLINHLKMLIKYNLCSCAIDVNYIVIEQLLNYYNELNIQKLIEQTFIKFFDEIVLSRHSFDDAILNILEIISNKNLTILNIFMMRRYLIKTIDAAIQEFELNNIHVKEAPTKLFNDVTRMLKYCFDIEIVLPQLLSRFWGLFQQANHILLERLKNYYKSKLLNYDDLDGLISLQLCLDLYQDSLHNMIQSDFKSFLSTNGILIFASIDQSQIDISKSINYLKIFFDDLIINVTMDCVNPVLEEVKNIPRLFRNTNRENPKNPSPHILNVISIIDNVYKKYDKINVRTKICNLTRKKYSISDFML